MNGTCHGCKSHVTWGFRMFFCLVSYTNALMLCGQNWDLWTRHVNWGCRWWNSSWKRCSLASKSGNDLFSLTSVQWLVWTGQSQDTLHESTQSLASWLAYSLVFSCTARSTWCQALLSRWCDHCVHKHGPLSSVRGQRQDDIMEYKKMTRTRQSNIM